MLDKRLGLARGTERVPAFTSMTALNANGTAASSVSQIVCTCTVNGTFGINLQAGAVTSGCTYETVVTVLTNSPTKVIYIDIGGGGLNLGSSLGTKRGIRVVTTTAGPQIYMTGGVVGDSFTISAASLKQIGTGIGTHALQATAGSRPVLSARVNLLTRTEEMSQAPWTRLAAGTGSIPVVTDNYAAAPDGTMTAARLQMTLNGGTTNADYARFLLGVPGRVIGQPIVENMWLKTADGTTKVLQWRDDLNAASQNITVTGSWQQFSRTYVLIATNLNAICLWLRGANGTASVADILIWHPQLETGTVVTRYQRVGATATDYDTVGFPVGLRCDGVDDGMVTAAINFSATDEMTVWAAMRKQSDAATGLVLELSANSNTNAGAWALFAPFGASPNSAMQSRGDATIVAVAPGSLAAPVTVVLTGQADISAPLVSHRRDGGTATTSAVTQGVGNYGNYPLYLFRRGGTTMPFNGLFYGAIVRGATTSAAQVVAVENVLKAKAGLA